MLQHKGVYYKLNQGGYYLRNLKDPNPITEVKLFFVFFFSFIKLTNFLVGFCCYSDYRSNIGPSDSERDCPSRRDSESSERWREKTQVGEFQPRLGVIQTGNDSESGGSHSPSPRATRKRQVGINILFFKF